MPSHGGTDDTVGLDEQPRLFSSEEWAALLSPPVPRSQLDHISKFRKVLKTSQPLGDTHPLQDELPGFWMGL